MKIDKDINLTLENFEGPLDLLFHLVHKCEIDIYEVALKNITDEFLSILKQQEAPFDKGAEFIATAATLVWFKSQQLLPKHEGIPQLSEEQFEDPHFEIIHHLIDYCRFKQAAKELVLRENEQSVFHPRGTEKTSEIKKQLGIEHLTLDDLAGLFKQIAAKAKHQKGQLHQETWKVSDKISALRDLLRLENEVAFHDLFRSELERMELIVIFLAVLEMMKLGELCVIKELATEQILIRRRAK